MYGSPPAKDLNRPFLQMSSGLLRYRSAPSSVFGELCDDDDFLPVRSTGPDTDTDTVFPRFLPTDLRLELRGKPPPPSSAAAISDGFRGGGQSDIQFLPKPPQVPVAVSVAEENAAPHRTAFSPAGSQVLYQQHLQQHQITNNLMPSINMEADQIKNSSNLIRQGSLENGCGAMKGTRLKSQLSFSSRQSSAAMSQISEEIEHESMGIYSTAPWEESPLSPDSNFSGGRVKRSRENKSDIRDSEAGNGLTHQFSLPKTLSEMAAMEKFLQFHNTVPCKIRAKRGCATHPRSIAERVRRTRISERMRKLQELVPNMDKQTNTADMLDLAVEYIKDLEKEVEKLSEGRASCTCSTGKQKPYPSS